MCLLLAGSSLCFGRQGQSGLWRSGALCVGTVRCSIWCEAMRFVCWVPRCAYVSEDCEAVGCSNATNGSRNRRTHISRWALSYKDYGASIEFTKATCDPVCPND